jgi:hypothetical protein
VRISYCLSWESVWHGDYERSLSLQGIGQASGVIEECGSCYGRINRMFREEICRELKLITYCVMFMVAKEFDP